MSTNPTLPPPLPPAVIPYASPTLAPGGVWREGNAIVAAKESVLPTRCVKCNAPVDPSRLKRKTFYHHHPALVLMILVGIIGIIAYVIVSLLVRKQGAVTFCFCDRHRTRRRIAIPLAWLLIPGGFAGVIFGAIDGRWDVGIAGAVLIAGGIVAAVFAQGLRAKKIDPYYVWLKGTGRDFLAELPTGATR